ncbi:MAG TPA: diaminopimelate decarboxylase [Chthoniobacterales bacterium]|jgi:diaminopimelate decarboxylase|nr:diaminopimelate decarboxylase [Chthoniobacterales bacterium]
MSFTYRNQELVCEGVAVGEIAARIGTPFYLYSARQLRENFGAYERAFAGANATICFAVKSCSNIAILKLLEAAGAGADTVSEGEIRRALLAGIAPENIIFSGVGKTKGEIAFALESGIGQLNVESPEELEMIEEIAAARKVEAKISVRVNPDVDAGTHEKISTGRKSDKFGVPWREASATYARARSLSHLAVDGVACHIGSQITERAPFQHAFVRVVELVRELQADGFALRRIDLGGGVGIRYQDETPIAVSDYAQLVLEYVRPLGLRLFLEPGRSISASAGTLISEVQFIKHTGEKSFAVLDAGMNDLARPAIYGAYHEIVPVREGAPNERYDVVGPVCESSDIFGTNRQLPKLAAGDLVAILNAGAYGAAMSSNYNTRGLPPEVLVEGDQFTIIRKRQSFGDIIALENF